MSDAIPVFKKMAALVNDAADVWEEEHIENWGPGSKSPDGCMVVAGKTDADDLRAIAKLILAKNKIAAAQNSDHLDTIVRDHIPDVVWDWLHSGKGPFRLGKRVPPSNGECKECKKLRKAIANLISNVNTMEKDPENIDLNDIIVEIDKLRPLAKKR
jgi:hypothetical protein